VWFKFSERGKIEKTGIIGKGERQWQTKKKRRVGGRSVKKSLSG
jgi:hypothetical protein